MMRTPELGQAQDGTGVHRFQSSYRRGGYLRMLALHLAFLGALVGIPYALMPGAYSNRLNLVFPVGFYYLFLGRNVFAHFRLVRRLSQKMTLSLSEKSLQLEVGGTRVGQIDLNDVRSCESVRFYQEGLLGSGLALQLDNTIQEFNKGCGTPLRLFFSDAKGIEDVQWPADLKEEASHSVVLPGTFKDIRQVQSLIESAISKAQ